MEQDFAFVKGQATVVSQLTNFLSSCNTWLMNFRFFFFWGTYCRWPASFV